MNRWWSLWLLPLMALGQPLSNRAQTINVFSDLMVRVQRELPADVRIASITFESNTATAAYLKGVAESWLRQQNGGEENARILSAHIIEPNLSLAFEPNEGGRRNTDYRRQLKLQMKLVITETVSGELVYDGFMEQRGSDPVRSQDLSQLQSETFPGTLARTSQGETFHRSLPFLLSVSSLTLIALLFFMRTK